MIKSIKLDSSVFYTHKVFQIPDPHLHPAPFCTAISGNSYGTMASKIERAYVLWKNS